MGEISQIAIFLNGWRNHFCYTASDPSVTVFYLQFIFTEIPLKRFEIKVIGPRNNEPAEGGFTEQDFFDTIPFYLSAYGLYYSLKYKGSSSCFSMNS